MRWGNYKKFVRNAGEFSHKYECWAYNHRGWAKMKQANRKLAKKRKERWKRMRKNETADQVYRN